MSTVLSYRAFRSQPLSPEEAGAIDIVIARYQSDFEYRESIVSIDPDNPKAPQTVFSGTITFPDAESFHYWTFCLTDIRRILDDATWNVSVCDVALCWDEDDGWYLSQCEKDRLFV